MSDTAACGYCWTVDQEREALRRVLAELDESTWRRILDVPTVMWGASMVMLRMREVLNGK